MLDAVFQRLSQKYQPSSIKVYRNTLIKIFREAYQTSDQDLQMFQNFERFRKYLTTVPNHLRRSQVFTVILVLKGAHLLELATPYEKLYDQLTQESVGQNTQSNQIIYNIQNMRGKSSVVLDTLRRKVSQLHDRARKFHHDTKDQRNYLIGLLYTFLPLRADELVQLRIGYVDQPLVQTQIVDLIGPYLNAYNHMLVLGRDREMQIPDQIYQQVKIVSRLNHTRTLFQQFHPRRMGDLVKGILGYSIAEIRREFIKDKLYQWSSLPVEQFEAHRERLARHMGHSIEAQGARVHTL